MSVINRSDWQRIREAVTTVLAQKRASADDSKIDELWRAAKEGRQVRETEQMRELKTWEALYHKVLVRLDETE